LNSREADINTMFNQRYTHLNSMNEEERKVREYQAFSSDEPIIVVAWSSTMKKFPSLDRNFVFPENYPFQTPKHNRFAVVVIERQHRITQESAIFFLFWLFLVCLLVNQSNCSSSRYFFEAFRIIQEFNELKNSCTKTWTLADKIMDVFI
jgi:hypothetical protein